MMYINLSLRINYQNFRSDNFNFQGKIKILKWHLSMFVNYAINLNNIIKGEVVNERN